MSATRKFPANSDSHTSPQDRAFPVKRCVDYINLPGRSHRGPTGGDLFQRLEPFADPGFEDPLAGNGAVGALAGSLAGPCR